MFCPEGTYWCAVALHKQTDLKIAGLPERKLFLIFHPSTIASLLLTQLSPFFTEANANNKKMTVWARRPRVKKEVVAPYQRWLIG